MIILNLCSLNESAFMFDSFNNLIFWLDNSKLNVFTEKSRSRECGGSHVKALTLDTLFSSVLNIQKRIKYAGSGITAPEGAGHLKDVNLQRSLRNVYDNHYLIGNDCHAESITTELDANLEDRTTSYRDGPADPPKFEAHGESVGFSYSGGTTSAGTIIILSEDVLVICKVSIADCKKNNEVREIQFLRGNALKTHGLSPFSSASLYLNTQTSTPCAIEEKSRDSTFFSKYSIRSEGNATVNDFLRILIHFKSQCFELIINNLMQIASLSCNLHEGALHNDKKQTDSESYGRRDQSTEHLEEHHYELQRELRIPHSAEHIRLDEFDGGSEEGSGILRQHIYVQCLAESSGRIVKGVA